MPGLGYHNQQEIVIFGSKSGTTRTSTTIGSAYGTVPLKSFSSGGASKVSFYLLYTTGTGETNNSIEVKVETSPDGTNFYQLLNESVSGATSTLTQREFTFVGAAAATTYALSLPLDISDKYVRVGVKESGVAANYGTIYGEVTLSGV